eukprot:440073-Rhodomonas_salina.4
MCEDQVRSHLAALRNRKQEPTFQHKWFAECWLSVLAFEALSSRVGCQAPVVLMLGRGGRWGAEVVAHLCAGVDEWRFCILY